jgi:TusA-related sulfurtransferase
MVIADIVSRHQLPENIVCDATLWASCIGGAGQEDTYKNSIEDAGMEVLYVAKNAAYEFVSKSAKHASDKYGVKSVSLFAEKKAVIKPDQQLKAEGLACLNLTPEISKAMKNIEPLKVLEVFSDDPASRVGIPAWCRLTGHTLLEVNEINPNDTVFFIQKKSS